MNIATIGTRNLTPEQVEILANKGLALANEGHFIFSGNALGADQAWVSKLSPEQYGLYLPWESYEIQSRPKNPLTGHVYEHWCVPSEEVDYPMVEELWNEFAELTKKQQWEGLKRGTKALQARNYLMIKDADEVYAAPGWKWENNLHTPIGGTAFGIFLAHQMSKPFHLLQWAIPSRFSTGSDFAYHVWSYDNKGTLVGQGVL